MIQVGEDREIKFDKELRYKRQEDYNINNYDLIDFGFSMGDKKVYKNLNFSIFLDDYCNADCKFCVAQLRYSHRKLMYDKKHIEDKNEYLKRLEEVLGIVIKLNPSISITGGEPTLSPLFPDVIKLVDEYGFRKRTITTNGSGLLLKNNNKTNLDYLINHNFNHLNISRVSMDDTENQVIMRYKDKYCDNKMLSYIIDYIKNSGLKHRISCLLIKEAVNSVKKMEDYVNRARELGANNFIFRELMDFGKDAINKEKIKFCKDNKVRLNDIWQELETNEKFKPYLNILGYYYYVEIYKYGDCTIASESADLNQQYVEKEKNPNVVYEMIFHNNGNLCGSWVDSEEILDKYKGND